MSPYTTRGGFNWVASLYVQNICIYGGSQSSGKCLSHLLTPGASEHELQCVLFMFNCWKYLFSKSHKIVFQISKVLKMLVDNDSFV